MRTVEPRIGQAFADWMTAQDDHKDHAADTPARFSSVMGCPRADGYYFSGFEPSDPMDGASLAITKMGSLLHEDIQKAIHARWSHVLFEGKGQIGDLISGHFDYYDELAKEVGEIKTVGAYKFDLATGRFKSPGKGKPAFQRPEGGKGPSISHICQGGMNALAQGAETVRICYLSREAWSVKKAREANVDSIGRFWAEWVFGEDEWAPLVKAELDRLTRVKLIVEGGMLPDRADFDDKGKMIKIDPATHWRCDGYCQFATRCLGDGPGRIPINHG